VKAFGRIGRHVAVGLEFAAIVIWGVGTVIAATPCGFSGRGPLVATPRCPVQTVHVLDAVVGAIGCVSLLLAATATVGSGPGTSRAKKLTMALSLATAVALFVAWAVLTVALPRAHPSD
jgi:hypothetical protein